MYKALGSSPQHGVGAVFQFLVFGINGVQSPDPHFFKGIKMYGCNPSTWQVGKREFQGYPQLYIMFELSLGYSGLCLKNKTKRYMSRSGIVVHACIQTR